MSEFDDIFASSPSAPAPAPAPGTAAKPASAGDSFDDMTYQDGLGPWFQRIIFALAFFLIIGVILFDIVTGTVVDKFSYP